MRNYRSNSHSKYDLKVHLIWIPKYRKRCLTGGIAERTRDILRQICMEHEIQIFSGKVTADHVHMFVSYRPQLALSKLVQFCYFIHERNSFIGVTSTDNRIMMYFSITYVSIRYNSKNPLKTGNNNIK